MNHVVYVRGEFQLAVDSHSKVNYCVADWQRVSIDVVFRKQGWRALCGANIQGLTLFDADAELPCVGPVDESVDILLQSIAIAAGLDCCVQLDIISIEFRSDRTVEDLRQVIYEDEKQQGTEAAALHNAAGQVHTVRQTAPDPGSLSPLWQEVAD